MTSREWARIKQVFCNALDQEPASRGAYLRQVCCGDPTFQSQIETLLIRHAESNQLFDDCSARRGQIVRCFDSFTPTLTAGNIISGRWVIEQLVGRGGMGEVYRARDLQVRRIVAIKLLHRQAGCADFFGRFQQERDILAALDHPNIARLLDAGTTLDQQPYLVMEYVQGLPLDEYCDKEKLDLASRLKVFQQVCRAVHHAHQNLTVHRDLKPGNILVTEQGEIKLLDFGIAKLLQPTGGDPSATPTQTKMCAMTPEYASPEQVRNLLITTSTDVYALGVILYLLLTGEKPYSLIGKAPHEVSQIICEQLPVSPSALAKGAGKKRTLVAAGDLDTILLHALRKEPSERYSSVEQFSDDVQLYLEGKPIRARQPTVSYIVSKFVQRNTISTLVTAVLVILFIAGSALVVREMQIARVERDRAQLRFRDVHALSNWLLFDLHDAVARLPGATELRALLVERALQYLSRLERDVGQDPALEREVASAYERIGYVQGHPSWGNIGNTRAALLSFRKALSIRQAIADSQPDNANARRELAAGLQNLGEVLQFAGDLPDALHCLRRSLDLVESLAAANPLDKSTRATLAQLHHAMGRAAERNGDGPTAQQHYRQALIEYEQLAASSPQDAEISRDLSLVYKQNGVTLAKNGDIRQAFTFLHRALSMDEGRVRKDPTPQAREDLSFAHSDLGETCLRAGDIRNAKQHYRTALLLRLQLTSADQQNARLRRYLALSYASSAQVFAASGELPASVDNYRRAITLLEFLSKLDTGNVIVRRDLTQCKSEFASVLLKQGETAMSKDRKTIQWRRALNLLKNSKSDWNSMKNAGTLWAEDLDKPAQIDRKLELCQAGLIKLTEK